MRNRLHLLKHPRTISHVSLASPTQGIEGGDILKRVRKTGNPRYFSIILSAPLSTAEGNLIPGLSQGLDWNELGF